MNTQQPRRILLAVTGLTPQVVTETLYALACRAQSPWIPHEIHLITTAIGAENARLNLLAGKAWFDRMLNDYGLPTIAFPIDNIHILRGADNQPLDDIRTPEHNTLAADFITDTVRRLTETADTELHVSIAGGRKTMGYYLGYALSLYGRAQDKLSHVLVSEPFETNRDFYYPTPYEHPIHSQRGGKETTVDARNARVDLADIPFVRLRDGLPIELLQGRARFSAAVAEAQKALPQLLLEVDPEQACLIAGGERITLAPAELAFYWLLAVRCHAGRPGIHWSDKPLHDELASLYATQVNPHSGAYERFEDCGLSKETFHSRKRHINAALEKTLGRRRAEPYLIQTQAALPGKGRCQPYALTLPPAAIKLPAASLRR